MSYNTEYMDAKYVKVERYGRKEWNRENEEDYYFVPIAKGRKILTLSADNVVAIEGTTDELREFAGKVLEAVGIPIQIPSPAITKPRDLIQGVLGLHYFTTTGWVDGVEYVQCQCSEMYRSNVRLREHIASKIMEVIA